MGPWRPARQLRKRKPLLKMIDAMNPEAARPPFIEDVGGACESQVEGDGAAQWGGSPPPVNRISGHISLGSKRNTGLR